MPALDDDREETIAQELAKGATQAAAWLSAGYSAKNNNVASVECNKLLKKKPEIRERADELRAIARDQIKTEEFIGDVATMTKLLLEDRHFAQQKGQAGAAVSASSALMKLYRLGGENIIATVRKHEDALADLD
jgi:hypothetical protein